jgi:hypothetical protein
LRGLALAPEGLESLPIAKATRVVEDLFVMEVKGDVAVRDVVERTLADGARLESIATKRETLEDLFVRRAL